MKDDVSKVISLIPVKTYNNVRIITSEQIVQYSLDSTNIKFPYRMYCMEVSDEVIKQLSLQQKIILHCIYSRSCSGFVRQKHLKSLLQTDYADWAIPYIVKICDEYVLEILEMTYGFLKEQDMERIKRFCLENVQEFCKSYFKND